MVTGYRGAGVIINLFQILGYPARLSFATPHRTRGTATLRILGSCWRSSRLRATHVRYGASRLRYHRSPRSASAWDTYITHVTPPASLCVLTLHPTTTSAPFHHNTATPQHRASLKMWTFVTNLKLGLIYFGIMSHKSSHNV